MTVKKSGKKVAGEEPTLQVKLAEITKEVTRLTKSVPEAITTEEQVVEATELLGVTKSRLKRIEELRKFFVDPLNKQVKEINAMFKEQSAPIEVIETTVKRLIGAFRMKQEEEARKEEARLAKLAEKKNERREEKGLEPISTPVATVERPQATVQTDSGVKSTARKVWKYRVVNIDLVPRQYLRCEVKHADVQYAIASGVRQIDGLELYEDFDVSVRAQ